MAAIPKDLKDNPLGMIGFGTIIFIIGGAITLGSWNRGTFVRGRAAAIYFFPFIGLAIIIIGVLTGMASFLPGGFSSNFSSSPGNTNASSYAAFDPTLSARLTEIAIPKINPTPSPSTPGEVNLPNGKNCISWDKVSQSDAGKNLCACGTIKSSHMDDSNYYITLENAKNQYQFIAINHYFEGKNKGDEVCGIGDVKQAGGAIYLYITELWAKGSTALNSTNAGSTVPLSPKATVAPIPSTSTGQNLGIWSDVNNDNVGMRVYFVGYVDKTFYTGSKLNIVLIGFPKSLITYNKKYEGLKYNDQICVAGTVSKNLVPFQADTLVQSDLNISSHCGPN